MSKSNNYFQTFCLKTFVTNRAFREGKLRINRRKSTGLPPLPKMISFGNMSLDIIKGVINPLKGLEILESWNIYTS